MTSSRSALRLSLALTLVSSCLMLGAAPLQAQTCPPTFGNGKLCTAKDFQVTSVLVNGPDECTEGDTIQVELVVGLEATSSERYDVGLFVGDNGGPVIEGDSCSFTSLFPQTTSDSQFDGTDPDGLGPFRNLDGDACGDVQSSDGINYKRFQLNSVLCRDSDGDGDVDIEGLVAWSSNANQDVCTDPLVPSNFFPLQSSKCQLDTDYSLPIEVEPEPSIAVEKYASPEELEEPGGSVTFYVGVFNTSSETDPITLTSLVDDIHGDLNGQGTCSVPQTIRPGESYLCQFVADVNGNATYSETDTVTATGVDDDGEAVSASDQATVTIIDALTPPSLEVVKVGLPSTVEEPGGTVTYRIAVANTSDTESITINSLDDDIYGNLFTQGTCGNLSGRILAAGRFTLCQFQAPVPLPQDFPGQPGDSVTDVVTAGGTAEGGQPVSDSASATITITDVPSNLEALKYPVPSVRFAPGGTFRFYLGIQNASPTDTVTVNFLFDDKYGNLNGLGSCSVPQVLTPSAIYVCDFPGDFTGKEGDFQVDNILIRGVDDDNKNVFAVARAQVDLIAPDAGTRPALTVIKTASPTSLPEPGGDVTFSVEVVNTSPLSTITLTGLVDVPYGDLANQGTCTDVIGTILAPTERYTCEFTVPVTGVEGDQLVDVVTATGGIGNAVVTADDDATVTILGNDSASLVVTKDASPLSVITPGGPVRFDISVSNLSANQPVQVNELIDSVYGDLAGQGTCTTGFTLQPGQTFDCNFTQNVNGPESTLHLDTVYASGTDADNNVLFDSARALVFIRGAADVIEEIPVFSWWQLLALSVGIILIVRRLR